MGPQGTAPSGYCHCGRPLHYNSVTVKAMVDELVAWKGPYTVVRVGDRAWKVQRHYIALHGLKAAELPSLGFEEITEQAC